MAPGAAARPVMDIAGIDIAHAVGAGDITGMRQGRGRRRGLVAHLPVGMECGEMQRHIGAKGIRQPAAQRIDLAIRIVLAGDQQCGDLKPDTGISLEVDQRIQHALVGIDIVFAEPDRLSPTEIARELPDLPRALADALAQLPPSLPKISQCRTRITRRTRSILRSASRPTSIAAALRRISMSVTYHCQTASMRCQAFTNR